MDRVKRSRLMLVILAAAVYAWAFAACQGAGNSVYLALENGVALQTAEKIFSQEESPVGCCFWGEEAGQEASCPATGQRTQVTRIYLSGNTGLLGAEVLSWQEGCLVDKQTAISLFGTEVCGGQRLSWNGRTYPVLGAVSALRPALIMRAEPADPMNRCILALPAENGKQLGEQFLLRFGLRGTVLDFYPIWALARNFLLLAPLVILAAIYKGQLNCPPKGRSPEDSGRRMELLDRCKKCLIPALALLLLWRGIVIPPEMIPSRWSDFSFWGRWWDAQRENLRYILFTPLGGRQLQILLNMVKSMIGSLLAALLVHRACQ